MAQAQMDTPQLQAILDAVHAQQAPPTTGPLPRRTRIYLIDEQRPEIHGRPMIVCRVDAKEWCAKGLASEAPLADAIEAASGPEVLPPEYRAPVNPPPPVDLGLVLKELAELKASAPPSPPADPAPVAKPAQDDELAELRAQWQAENLGKKAPPAAKAKWFKDRLGKE